MTPDKRYYPGRGCGRGRHDYSRDMGNYLRCPRCGSTKTKPAAERGAYVSGATVSPDGHLLNGGPCPKCQAILDQRRAAVAEAPTA